VVKKVGTRGETVSKRAAGVIAWGMLVVAVVFILLLQWVLALPHPQKLGIETIGNSPFAFLGGMAFSVVGALVVSHYPRHPIGWIFAVAGLLVGMTAFTTGYAQYAQEVPGVLPAADFATAISDISFGVAFLLPITFGLLLFPDGHLPSRRWRPVAWFTVLCLSLLFVGFPFFILFPFVLASSASLIIRWRRARGQERQQLKWIGVAALFLILLVALDIVLIYLTPNQGAGLGFLLFSLAYSLIPISAGIAILKYRLYDIDLIIRKTLTYSLVVALLLGIYFGGVILLQQIFANLAGLKGNELITVISTLIIAGLFVPLRNHIQTAIDKRFYRKKYDAQQVLQKFSETVRDETDLEKLTNELVNVVQETMQPKSVSVWLKKTADKKQ
jgi:hypothetical protein